jgi:hypothetical protein
MTPTEVNAVLTFAALLDSRMKRTDPNEMADRAEAWALTIPAEVTVEAARAAVTAHYQRSSEVLMVADLIALAGVAEVSPWVDRTDEALLAIATRELAALGTTPEEYRKDPVTRARVNAALDKRELEGGER